MQSVIPNASNYAAETLPLRRLSLSLASVVSSEAEHSDCVCYWICSDSGSDELWQQAGALLDARNWHVVWVFNEERRFLLLAFPRSERLLQLKIGNPGEPFFEPLLLESLKATFAEHGYNVIAEDAHKLALLWDGCTKLPPDSIALPDQLDNPFPDANYYLRKEKATRYWTGKIAQTISGKIDKQGFVVVPIKHSDPRMIDHEVLETVLHQCKNAQWRVAKILDAERKCIEQVLLLRQDCKRLTVNFWGDDYLLDQDSLVAALGLLGFVFLEKEPTRISFKLA